MVFANGRERLNPALVVSDEKWGEYLEKLPGSLSEHIRQAVNTYIGNIESKKVRASQSKGSDKDA